MHPCKRSHSASTRLKNTALLGATKSEEADGVKEIPKIEGGILRAAWFS